MFLKYSFTIMGLFVSTILWAGADWDYNNSRDWANTNQKYQACAGVNQSPIDIRDTVSAHLPPLKLNYHTTAKSVQNTGHTMQIDFNKGASLELDGQNFYLEQFHIHSPSENNINGQSYPMELHLVHASEQGELAVIALMFQQGLENEKLNHIWSVLPTKLGESNQLYSKNNADSYLPQKLDYYRFNGSLTTPPCTEGVRWVVLKEIQQASSDQIGAFTQLMGHPNNRPIQSIGARLILE
ncbi:MULTISPECIES: carbonic anhydrase family protein [unclassified Acinetobacter]|uniref:carbonic anhydrase n=1 Tax=unclassified Acinetobacter TaxID=196816 RepID=UPI0018AAF4EE|nr:MULTISPECIES: carbonic anhydrase family protein [unclassified Acinetobacter]MBJ9952833.1 carbonic anhydrase family protein [Acinetobacter baumannii]